MRGQGQPAVHEDLHGALGVLIGVSKTDANCAFVFHKLLASVTGLFWSGMCVSTAG